MIGSRSAIESRMQISIGFFPYILAYLENSSFLFLYIVPLISLSLFLSFSDLYLLFSLHIHEDSYFEIGTLLKFPSPLPSPGRISSILFLFFAYFLWSTFRDPKDRQKLRLLVDPSIPMSQSRSSFDTIIDYRIIGTSCICRTEKYVYILREREKFVEKWTTVRV